MTIPWYARVAVFTAAVVLTAAVDTASAQLLKEDLPPGAQGIDVENKIGERIPLDSIFTDERGNKVGLGKFFNKKKAIVLTLNYSDCPGLCIAQLDNLVETLRKSNAAGLGDEFEIVTISIDPREDHFKASNTKAKYTGLLTGTKARESWHFLVGKQSEISKVANAVGFKYTYDSANKRYNHPAAIFFVSPDGQICRYLLSLGVEPQQFKLAVADAGSGTLDFSIADSILQFCYQYDPNANRYTASARRMLAFAAGAFSLLLVGTTAPFWFRGKKATQEAEGSEELGTSEESSDELVGFTEQATQQS